VGVPKPLQIRVGRRSRATATSFGRRSSGKFRHLIGAVVMRFAVGRSMLSGSWPLGALCLYVCSMTALHKGSGIC
jgi:hypothetical protein